MNLFRLWGRLGLPARAAVAVAAVAALAFAYWTISPLFISRTVNEPPPAVAAMAEQPTAAMMADKATPDAMMADKATPDAMMAETATPDAMMADKATPDAMMADKATPDAMMAETATPDAMMADKTPEAMAEPGIAAQGTFISSTVPGHHAEGTAVIYREADGKLILRLEGFAATNGPDLFVTLHPAANPEQGKGEYLQIAPLKADKGSQNYELPAGTDLSGYRSVVIWCRTFNVVFGYATLQASGT